MRKSTMSQEGRERQDEEEQEQQEVDEKEKAVDETENAANGNTQSRRRKGKGARARQRRVQALETHAVSKSINNWPANKQPPLLDNHASLALDRRPEQTPEQTPDQTPDQIEDQVQVPVQQELPLRRGDIVVSVPSPKFPRSVKLEVLCLIWSSAKGDYAVHFRGNPHKAWLRNLGRTYTKKL